MSHSCRCGSDYIHIKKHFNGRQCYKCGGQKFSISQVCGCVGQCGCQVGVSCDNCNAILMPPTGEGWCITVRTLRAMLKDQNIPNRCVRIGCNNQRINGHDYCSWSHAKADGN